MNPDAEYPILNYQGAGRVWSQKREKTENVFKKNTPEQQVILTHYMKLLI